MKPKTGNRSYGRVLSLEYLTIVWNVIEGAVAVSVGISNGSLALVAFGLESAIEVFSSAVVIWDLRGKGNGRRKYALRMIGTALVVVSALVGYGVIASFRSGHRQETTLVGIAAMAAITLGMAVIGILKRRLGKRLGDPVVVAESGITLLDAGLSASIMIGLLCHLAFGWWWTDQVLALLVAANAFREGVKNLWAGRRR